MPYVLEWFVDRYCILEFINPGWINLVLEIAVSQDAEAAFAAFLKENPLARSS